MAMKSHFARVVAWGLVTVVAGVLLVLGVASYREASGRSATAEAEFEAEEIRIGRQTRERANAAKMRQIEDTHRRNLYWIESQQQSLQNRQRLNEARRARLRAEFELEQEQKRAAR